MMNKKDLISPCGLDCFNCPIYEGNIYETSKKDLAIQTGVPEDVVSCKGCIEQKGHCPGCQDCETYVCVTGKGLQFCYECDDFPCFKLQPAVDGANFFPHNMKVYNLCRMKAIGVEKWAEDEATLIRKKYYTGKFKVGSGPQLI
ncbi:MAG: DUF3795 domain-containing protein [Bacillota bacterium]|jgi:hypothetical protein